MSTDPAWPTLRILPAPPAVSLEVAFDGEVKQVLTIPANTAFIEVFSPTVGQRAAGANYCVNFVTVKK